MITENGGSPSVTVLQRILPEGALATGIFGAVPAGAMPWAVDFDAPMVGLMRTGDGVLNAPLPSWPWGTLLTRSSCGAGADGRRTMNGFQEGEVAYQMFYTTQGVLLSRGGIWPTGWGRWVKRWDK
ncbi:hypothetical protein IMC39_004249 [Salmonella enterica]|nr:hypothetical protein [Salmonella enterica]